MEMLPRCRAVDPEDAVKGLLLALAHPGGSTFLVSIRKCPGASTRSRRTRGPQDGEYSQEYLQETRGSTGNHSRHSGGFLGQVIAEGARACSTTSTSGPIRSSARSAGWARSRRRRP